MTHIGIIGGSDLYRIDGLAKARWQDLASPWDAPSDLILTGRLGETRMAFLPRHGRGHVHMPRRRAEAARVTQILSVSACGSLREMAPDTTAWLGAVAGRVLA